MLLPHRKQTRLKDYDYSQNGAYFITICTHNRLNILGKICRGGALLLPVGEICKTQIHDLKQRYKIKIDKFVIMPNHIHMIILIDDNTLNSNKEEQSPSPTISDIICAFKSQTTKIANRQDNVAKRKIWQRGFHDHIVRSEKSYLEIWEYIDTNPLKWADDCYYNN